MKWNWQREDWPNFTWDSDKLVVYERSFTESAGIIIGSSQHISQEGKQNLFIDLMCTDALDSKRRLGRDPTLALTCKTRATNLGKCNLGNDSQEQLILVIEGNPGLRPRLIRAKCLN
ncbi:TPA: DUF4172 domain-containing protein [Legionella feeleii]